MTLLDRLKGKPVEPVKEILKPEVIAPPTVETPVSAKKTKKGKKKRG